MMHSDNNALAHFGTKGMKWGVRRFQNEDGSLTALGRERYGSDGVRGAYGTKLDLNKLDREQTNAKSNYEYYTNKQNNAMARANKRLAKAKAKGNSAKIAKAQSRLSKVENSGNIEKAAQYKDLYERSKALTDKIIAKSLEKGYSIHSKDVLREVSRGSNAAASALGTIGGMAVGAVTGVGIIYMQTDYDVGKHYNVKNDGLGLRTHKVGKFA